MQSIPRSERLLAGTSFNGHAGAGNKGDEEWMTMFVPRMLAK